MLREVKKIYIYISVGWEVKINTKVLQTCQRFKLNKSSGAYCVYGGNSICLLLRQFEGRDKYAKRKKGRPGCFAILMFKT